jgi:hypothetical protein
MLGATIFSGVCVLMNLFSCTSILLVQTCCSSSSSKVTPSFLILFTTGAVRPNLRYSCSDVLIPDRDVGVASLDCSACLSMAGALERVVPKVIISCRPLFALWSSSPSFSSTSRHEHTPRQRDLFPLRHSMRSFIVTHDLERERDVPDPAPRMPANCIDVADLRCRYSSFEDQDFKAHGMNSSAPISYPDGLPLPAKSESEFLLPYMTLAPWRPVCAYQSVDTAAARERGLILRRRCARGGVRHGSRERSRSSTA